MDWWTMRMWTNVCRSAALLLLFALLTTGPTAQAQDLEWQPFEEALATAQTHGKPVLVDVWAPWCGWCRRMKAETYPALAEQLSEDFVLTRLNRDDNDGHVRYRGARLTPLRLAQKLGAEGVPAIVFLAPRGEPLLQLSGFLEADALRPVLDYIGSGAYRVRSFDAFREGPP